MIGNQIYLQNVILCTLVTGFLYVKALNFKNSAGYHTCFIACILGALIFDVTEIVYAYLRLHNGFGTEIMFWTLAANYIAISYFCYRCYRFFRRSVLYDAHVLTKAERTLCRIPVYLTIILVVLSRRYNIIFSVSETGEIIHEKLYFVSMLFSYGYIVAGLVISYVGYYRHSVTSARRLRNIFKISIPCLIVCCLQMLIGNLPYTAIAITLSIMLLYSKIMDAAIDFDDLTSVGTKATAKELILKKIEENKIFYIVIVDLDGFKAVNDTYGHTEGDKLLQRFGWLLNDVCSKYYAKATRFGGDEFCIIADYEPSDMMDEIREKAAKITVGDSNRGIRMSAGIYKRTAAVKDINELFEMADINMYEEKKRHHEIDGE